MKINSNSSKIDNSKIAFCAGKTTLGSDFDGVYMPKIFNHDSICRNNPEVNKNEFQSYFDSFDSFINTAKGKDDKFALEITTGRNLGEFNFFLKKIKEQGLKIPMPNSVTISNGADTFENKNANYFTSDAAEAFSPNDFSTAKRDWVKEASKGWDGDNIKKAVNEVIESAIISPKKNRRVQNLGEFIDVKDGRSVGRLAKIYDEIIRSDMDKEQIKNHIEKLSANTIANSENPDKVKTDIWVLTNKIFKDKQTPKEFSVFQAKTLQSAMFYDEDMTLEGQLRKLDPRPEEVIAMNDNGNLNFHIGLTQSETNQQVELAKRLSEKLTAKNIIHNIESIREDASSVGFNSEKLSSVTITPLINGQKLDKFHDYKKQMDEIIKGNTNDLVIVAGDGPNDAKLLNLFNYIGENGMKENFTNIETLKKLYDLPAISIFVDNGQKVNDGGIDFDLIDKYFNSDGNVRFIHVDPKCKEKPQNLLEATKVAMKEYAKRNVEYAKNLSEQMQDELSKMTYEYPIDKEFIEKLEEENNIKIYNPAPALDFEKLKTAAKTEILNDATKAPKSKTGIIIAAVLAVGGVIAGVIVKNKNKKSALLPNTNVATSPILNPKV